VARSNVPRVVRVYICAPRPVLRVARDGSRVYFRNPTPDDKPTMADDLVVSMPDDLVVSMATSLFDTEGTTARKGRRTQSRTSCRNRHGRKTNPLSCALMMSFVLITPPFENQTRQFLTGCSRAA
jgi:hypothetical protein